MTEIPGLPPGIDTRTIADVNGLDMFVLEAGNREAPRGLLLLLHGFPELAYSWRKVIVPLADAGFHVVAPDHRGYGRTTGWDGRYDGDVGSFGMLNLVRDVLALTAALGYETARLAGHDFGSPLAAWCALARPDVFRAAALMSAPFAGPPAFPRRQDGAPASPTGPDIHAALAALERPRKHYQWYYSTREADADMTGCPQGLRDFLRAYYHVKSADWPGNRPFPLAGWTAPELAKMPTYYIMDAGADMAETVAPFMPDRAEEAACPWLTDLEIGVYADCFGQTGFQGGLNWYRCMTDPALTAPLRLFGGRTIDVPCAFVAGKADWGTYQVPGALEAMQDTACSDFRFLRLIDGAGHWVQQEQPAATVDALLDFFDTTE